LNLALIALRQLHEDVGFKDISLEEISKEYDENSNTVKAFLDDKCVIDLTAPEYISLSEMYIMNILYSVKKKM
jgi:hypothetical protein